MKKEYHKLLILSIIGISALNFNVNLRENINNQGNIFISQDNTSDVIVDEIISDSIEIDSSSPNINNTTSQDSSSSQNSSSENSSNNVNNNSSNSSNSSSNEIKPTKKVKVYLNPSVQTKNLYVNNLGTEAEHMNDIVEYMVKELITVSYISLKYNLNFLSLGESIKDSNNYGSEIHLSLHSNAGGGQGSEIYTPIGKSHFGSYIYNEYTSKIGDFKKRGVKETSALYEIKNAKAENRALLELLFHDNVKEANFIVNNKKKIANILTQGIINYIEEFYLNIY